jgi:hypothetical protein
VIFGDLGSVLHFFLYPAGHLGFTAVTFFKVFPLAQVIVTLLTNAALAFASASCLALSSAAAFASASCLALSSAAAFASASCLALSSAILSSIKICCVRNSYAEAITSG